MQIRDFGYYRFAAVSPELRIANTEYNSDVIIDIINKNLDCDVLVFPELSITGYSCQDLFFQNSLINGVHTAIEKIRATTKEHSSTVIVGAPLASNNRLFNTAIVISAGQIIGVVPKSFLINYNEFYEKRWFDTEFERNSDTIIVAGETVPFGADLIFENIRDEKFKFGIEICEDLWTIHPPSIDLSIAGCSVIINLSSSNAIIGKTKYRQDLVRMHSSKTISAYIYSSTGLYESTTDTVYSASSMIGENGKLLSLNENYSLKTEICKADIDVEYLLNQRIKNTTFSSFRTNKKFRIINLDIIEKSGDILERNISQTPFIPKTTEKINEVCDEITNIQTAALCRRLLHINCKKIVIGISGGLDSTLALLVCYLAFQKLGYDINGIIAVTMPGFGTTSKTKNNAELLCEKLGIELKEIDIKDSVRLHFKEIGHNEEEHNVVYENAQARRRTHILMDLANKHNAIVVGTGDLSEAALGWCTFGGDHLSMYGINSGVPKTLIRVLINWYANTYFNNGISPILQDIIATPISPELLPPSKNNEITQETEKIIGKYLLNDFFFYYFVRHNFSSEKILFLANIAFENDYKALEIKDAYNSFIRRFFTNQFKRNTMPDGPKIGFVSLSPRTDWRMSSDVDYEIWLVD